MNVVSLIDDGKVRAVTGELREAASKFSRVHLKGEVGESVSQETLRERSAAMGENFLEASAIIGEAVRAMR